MVLAAACGALGLWQMDRRDQLVSTMDTVRANYDQPAVPYSTSLFSTFDPASEWSSVELTGAYDAANTRIVRNRPLNGRPGYEVLVPLRMDDGSSVIINRGWLPIGNDNAGRPDTVPAAPDGEVTVVARIKPGEPVLDRGAPEGQLASINLPGYEKQLGYPVLTAAYGLMSSESPSPASAPVALPKPALDLGPHLSYSMQWFAFGLLLFVGFGYAARQQRHLEYEESEVAAGRTPQPRAVKERRRPTAEQEEDAILDAQGY